MKIETDKENIILIPENDEDVFNLGYWNNKIPITCYYTNNIIDKATIELKHFLVLLKKCRM